MNIYEIATLIAVSTRLILGLVALLRGRREDVPTMLRELFRRRDRR